jgi:DNA-binding LacI/PurR family transcriptional regulator
VKKHTITDVARLAGTSVRTVSRVINEESHISEKTKHAVIAAIDELDFEANIVAQGLRGKPAKLIIAFADHQQKKYWANVHASFFSYINKYAARHGYRVLISSSSANPKEREENDGFTLLKSSVAGATIIFDVTENDNRIQYMKAHNIPFVANTTSPDPTIASVDSDSEMIGYLGARSIIAAGRKKIALFVGNLEYILNTQRKTGFERYLAERGGQGVTGRVFPFIGSIEAAYEKTLELTAASSDFIPDCIFVSGDERAMGVYRAAEERGLTIPGDLSVLGIDNIVLGKHFFPPLSTIEVHIEQQAEAMVGIIIDMLEKGSTRPRKIIVSPEFVQRESLVVGPLPGEGRNQ